jgi:hypothetical protein
MDLLLTQLVFASGIPSSTHPNRPITQLHPDFFQKLNCNVSLGRDNETNSKRPLRNPNIFQRGNTSSGYPYLLAEFVFLSHSISGCFSSFFSISVFQCQLP